MNPETFLVLANSYRDYFYWCRRNKINPTSRNTRYVYANKILYPYSSEAKIIFLSGWEINRDVLETEEIIKTRGYETFEEYYLNLVVEDGEIKSLEKRVR